MKKTIFFLAIFSILLSCKKEGCTNSKATNYNNEADKDDGSCTFKNDGYDGVYFVKDSMFYNNEFHQYKTYQLTVEFLSTRDSIIIKNMPGFSTENDLTAIISGPKLTIPQQPFDPNADAEGSGIINFGFIDFNLNYGVVRHSCVFTKN